MECIYYVALSRDLPHHVKAVLNEHALDNVVYIAALRLLLFYIPLCTSILQITLMSNRSV